jgi:hypothetical protein
MTTHWQQTCIADAVFQQLPDHEQEIFVRHPQIKLPAIQATMIAVILR